MNSPDTQSQKAVSDILSSIRQIISEDVQDDQKVLSEENKNSTDSQVLDLTRLVKEDGSVVQLSSQSQPSEAESSFLSALNTPSSSIEDTLSEENTISLVRPLNETPFMQNPSLSSLNPENDLSTASEPSLSFEPKDTLSEALQTPKDQSSSPQGVENLISQSALQESAAAFAELTRATQSVSAQTGVAPTIETVGNYTVEGLMRELMRPLLKDWLDAHLPSLVRTLVVEQIEKVLQQRNGPPTA